MKNILQFTLLLIFSINGLAQKCIVSNDPITNEKIIKYECKTSLSSWSKATTINFTFEIIDGNVYLSQSFIYAGVLSNKVPEGTEIIYKTKSGHIFNFTTVNETLPKAYFSSTEYRYIMRLSKNDLTKLANDPVSYIRIPKVLEAGYYDFDEEHLYTKQGGKLYSKGASCILESVKE